MGGLLPLGRPNPRSLCLLSLVLPPFTLAPPLRLKSDSPSSTYTRSSLTRTLTMASKVRLPALSSPSPSAHPSSPTTSVLTPLNP